MPDLTYEMQVALVALRRMGVRLHVTRSTERACGCVAQSGWDTVKLEPFVNVNACREHCDEAVQAIGRYFDADSIERFSDVEAHVAAMRLLDEQIAAAGTKGV